MKKTILSTILALVLSLSACTGAPPQPAVTEAANVALPGASTAVAADTESVSLPLVQSGATEAAATVAVSLPLVVGSETETVATESVNLPLVVDSGEGVVLNTSMGALEVVSTRFVDEVNGTRPEPGQKILLVILDWPGDERLTPDNFSLEEFDRARSQSLNGQQVHVLTDSGEMIITTMGGWISTDYAEFAMGFMVPDTATKFQLVWPGNAPVAVAPGS